MKFATVGVGGAGGRIVDRILEAEARTDRSFTEGNALAFDVARSTANDFEHLPDEQYVVLGDTHRDVGGDGVDGDADLAVEVARGDINEIHRAFDALEPYGTDGVLVVAGLGGGTGCGAGAVVVEELKATYDKPVYALGVLPAAAEGRGPALNAARALRTLVPAADNVVGFDNDARDLTGAEGAGSYAAANRELAVRVQTVLGAGETDGPTIAENVVDTSDVVRTLAPGGVSSVGYAATAVEPDGLLARLRARLRSALGRDGVAAGAADDDWEGETATDAARVKTLVRRATDSALTLPCEVASAERVLVVLSGPPSAFSRRGFESARYWLEERADTVEVLAGDDPRERASTLVAAVLFSNVTDVPRIKALQAQALAAGDRGGDAADADRAADAPDGAGDGRAPEDTAAEPTPEDPGAGDGGDDPDHGFDFPGR